VCVKTTWQTGPTRLTFSTKFLVDLTTTALTLFFMIYLLGQVLQNNYYPSHHLTRVAYPWGI
jgi:hypothetical protein